MQRFFQFERQRVMRVKNLMRNSFFSVLSQILLLGFGFFSNRVLNLKMGEALVGLNGVISNIISILSVSELGIAVAIVYNLYQALAARDECQIAGLMNLYRKAYVMFAVIISGLGLGIMPFLGYFLKDNPFTPGYVRLIYILWLVRTVLSYLLSYRRSLLIADQREYIVSITTLLVNAVNYSAVIAIVSVTQNYVAALVLNIVVEAAGNLWITRYVNRKYPFLRRMRRQTVPDSIRTGVFHNIKNVFVVRLATQILTATDNVIVSSFIGVAFAGRFSNYNLIINAINNISLSLAGSIQAGMGAVLAERDYRRGEDMLRLSTFLFFLLAASAGCGVYAAAEPFVGDLWLGPDYLLGTSVVGACVANLFLMMLSTPISMAMGVSGLFEQERNLAVISAILNMLLSVGMVKRWGIFGVLAGTFVAYLVQMCYRIYAFYRYCIDRSGRSYVVELMQYLLLGIAELALVRMIAQAVYGRGGILRFFLLCLVSAGLPLALNLIVYCKSQRLRSMFALVFGKMLRLRGGSKKMRSRHETDGQK